MPSSSNSVTPLIGRMLISLIFILSGISKIPAYSMMVGYAASKGLPLAHFGIAAAAAIEILGGLAVLIGFRVRIAAWLLFLYLIPTTFYLHNFWAMQGMERMDAQVHFMKNLAIMGGLLLLAAYGSGRYSVDSAQAKA